MRLILIVAVSLIAPATLRNADANRRAGPDITSRHTHGAALDPDSAAPRTLSASGLAAANSGQLPHWSAPWRAELRRSPTNRSAMFAVATAERLAYNLTRADALYRQVARTGRDQLQRQSLLFRAHIAANAGRFIFADSQFRAVEREARETADTLTALDAIVAYSGSTTRTAGANAGVAILARGDSLNWKREPALDGAARCRMSGLQSRLGNRERARSTAREGMAIAQRATLPRLVAACQFALATEFARTGLTDSLRGPLQSAMELQEKTGDMAGLAASKQWGGYYLSSLGKFPEAQQHLNAAWIASQRAGTVNTSAWIAINRAAIAQAFYDAAGYAEWLSRADTLMRKVDDAQGLIELLKMQTTRAHRAGDFISAQRYLSEARTQAEKLKEPNITFSISVVRWELAMSRGDIEEATVTTVERRMLIDRYRLTGWESEVAGDEAELFLRRGQGDKAMPLLDRINAAMHPSQKMYLYDVGLQRALAFTLQGDTRNAVKLATEAAESFDAWRASLNDRSLQLLSGQRQRNTGWINSKLNTYFAANNATDVAFALTERRRARELRDRLALASSLNPVAVGSDSTVQTVMSVSEIQRALPDDQTALVMMDAGDGGLPGTAFILTRKSLTAHAIPSHNEISPRIRRLVAALEAGRESALEARALGTSLLSPLLQRLDSARISRLVFLPEGVLHRLPFDVLKLPDGRYVAERFETAVAPSATVLARLAIQSARSGAPRTLALADAEARRDRISDTVAGSGIMSSLFRNSALFARLGGARNEVASVRRILPGTNVRTGANATESEVKRSAATYDVLHFATHAVVDEWSGATAALALTPGSGEDGLFDSSEIARLRLPASLVVLSACRTIGGEVIAGEGVRGLTGAFLQAGARTVIATSWRVNDRDVVPVVTAMYEHLARSRTTGSALREAKLAAIRSNVSPSVWGAFTLVGDPWRTVLSASR